MDAQIETKLEFSEPVRGSSAEQEHADPQETHHSEYDVIEAKQSSLFAWEDIWRYRELLYFLTWRDVKIRYKQTTLGVAWAVIQPVMNMVVFSIFFGRLAGMDHRTGGIPYPIYVFVGLIPWTFFANAVGACGSSVINSANLITKVYFPRLIIPIAAVGVGLVDFALSFMVLIGMMLFYHVGLTPQILLLPLFLFGTTLATIGIGTFMAALTVAYRDFRYVVPFLMQLWMFVTPVIYPSTLVPPQWRWLLALNPLAGMIDGFRSVLLGRPLEWIPICVSLVVSAALFIGGSAYFRAFERRFADII